MNKGHKIIPIFVPHLGCPNDCIFCNQKKITNVTTEVTPEDAETIIVEHLETLNHENTIIEISFFGGTFTGIPIQEQEALLAIAQKYKKLGFIDYIRLSTRPDYIDEQRLLILQKYEVDIVELGVQSLDDDVLKASNRGHSVKHVIDAVSQLKKFKIKVGIQIMPGLYKSSFESDISTVNQVIQLSPDFVRIYPTLIIKNTELENYYNENKYNPLTLIEAVDFCKIAYSIFLNQGIQIIRMGLQATEGINWDGDIVSGPFHPAFRSLVLSELYGDMIERYFEDKDVLKIKFKVASQCVSFVAGQNRKNTKKLLKNGIKEVKLYIEKIDQNLVSIEWENFSNEVFYTQLDLNEYCREIFEKFKNLKGCYN